MNHQRKQITTTIRWNTLCRLSKSKKMKFTRWRWVCEACLIICWWECKMVESFWKHLAISIEVKHICLYNPAILYLSILKFLRWIKTYVHKKTCIFTAFENNPNFQQHNQWLDKCGILYIEYFIEMVKARARFIVLRNKYKWKQETVL